MVDVIRCPWVKLSNPLYVTYHDDEWGRPVHDDRHHFEMIVLEGAQAGLSWETILNKRENYRKAFHKFDPVKVAQMTDEDIERLREDKGIVRNRLKIKSAIKNANAFLQIQKELGSFDHYIWAFVDNKPIVNTHKNYDAIPATTKLSDTISKDLKQRGFNFVGSTIIYAYMQAVGLVNDHSLDCSFKNQH